MNSIHRIAIVGSGIAGLTAAHLLFPRFDITVFEANETIGGHTHTVEVKTDTGDYAVDTGFIVFNPVTYPNFCQLLATLKVATQPSHMSFSFRDDSLPLEYGDITLNGLFAQRRNIVRPAFYRLLWDIWRGNQAAKRYLQQGSTQLTLAEWCRQQPFGRWFQSCYLLPLAAAIWSTPPTGVAQMPAHFVFQFYQHHGLLDLPQCPDWSVITGGSQRYVAALVKPFRDRIQCATAVRRIARDATGVTVLTETGQARFDAVVLACHSDQALALLDSPSQAEQEILSAIPYARNRVVLHTDTRWLPRHRRAWSSWNYQRLQDDQVSLTYYMNRLQQLSAKQAFCVSMNIPDIDPRYIIKQCDYSHPLYTQSSVQAKQRHADINAQQRTFYTGAYWGNGFHEDGVVASLNALAPFGVTL